jgi:L-ribulose-5-phosphate 4-epimerase
MSGYTDLKESAWRVNLQLPQSGLVTGTFGNASAYDKALGVFAIKPSGVPFNELNVDDMVVVDLGCNVVEGSKRPSSDTKTHAVLYSAWGDVGGIVHTHSPHAVAWAQAKLPIPVLGTTHADALAQDVPCTDVMTDEMIRGDYETETGNQILKRFVNLSPAEVEMVLVASHGPFTWGKTPALALEHGVMLELIARTALLTLQINPGTTRLNQALLKKHYLRKHGPDAYYGQY